MVEPRRIPPPPPPPRQSNMTQTAPNLSNPQMISQQSIQVHNNVNNSNSLEGQPQNKKKIRQKLNEQTKSALFFVGAGLLFIISIVSLILFFVI